jgi:hypothetical protein
MVLFLSMQRGKMIRGPTTCARCGELGHRQASSKCRLNGTTKKEVIVELFSSKILDNISFFRDNTF